MSERYPEIGPDWYQVGPKITRIKQYNPLHIPELEASVSMGVGEPIRHEGGLSRYDLLKVAESEGVSEIQLARIVARHMKMFQTSGESNQIGVRDTLNALWLICGGGEGIPYCVGQTTLAVLKFGVDENVDPSVFVRKRVKYFPNNEIDELSNQRPKIVFDQRNLNELADGPAILAGSILVTVEEDYKGKSVLMRRRHSSSSYPGSWSLPGGHSDRPAEVTAIEEVIEETALDSRFLSKAKPLGTADQLLIMGYGKQNIHPYDLSPRRYVNLIWHIDLNRSELSDKNTYGVAEGQDGRGDWTFVPDTYLQHMRETGEITPIANIALRLANIT